MNRINRLPLHVANQIAAGEVIERPASVVKELLENAQDAAANQIVIEIGYGGLNQIKIADDGVGIVAEDLPLAIAPHATSKINQLSDLSVIASMGFRGEALASIASISRLTIRSKPAEQAHAMQLSYDGQSLQLTPCARNQGTTIEVNDLFFNAPVRKKFLKTERSEFQAIDYVVKRFALSAPTIALQLSHNGKVLLHLPAAVCERTRAQRMQKILGKAFAGQAIYLETEHAGMCLSGWISRPEYQLSQADKQWIYVNSRAVKDKLLHHAIKQAYEERLYPGRYPVCLLYFYIDPAEVDVNVHPTKHEVRFQQERLVHDFIYSELQKALSAESYSKPVQLPLKQPWSIQEPYQPSPIFTTTGMQKPVKPGEQAINWIALNNSYALCFLQAEPYLLNVQQLQRQWLLSVLATQTLPLASRPLLVPVNYVSEQPAEAMAVYQSLVKQVGIDLERVAEQTFLIRSLPRQVPHLQCKEFLDAIVRLPTPNCEQLFDLLCQYQVFDLKLLLPEEISEFMHYLQHMQAESTTLPTWCKPLSLALCQELCDA